MKTFAFCVGWLCWIVGGLMTPVVAQAAPTARITAVHGEVFGTDGSGIEQPLQAPTDLGGAMSLRTASGAGVEIQLGDGSVVRLGGNGLLTLNPEGSALHLDRGSLLVHPASADSHPDIQTPTLQVTPHGGTVVLGVGEGGGTRVVVLTRGLGDPVQVSAVERHQEVDLKPGQAVVARGGSVETLRPVQVSVEAFAQTCGLLKTDRGFSSPLPRDLQKQLQVSVQSQTKDLRRGSLALADRLANRPTDPALQLSSVNQTTIQAANWRNSAGTYLAQNALVTVKPDGNWMVQSLNNPSGSPGYGGVMVIMNSINYGAAAGALSSSGTYVLNPWVGNLNLNGSSSVYVGGLTLHH